MRWFLLSFLCVQCQFVCLLSQCANNLTLFVQTDCWPGELGWYVLRHAGGTISSVFGETGENFAELTNTSTSMCLDDGCYSLLMNDTFGDGVYTSSRRWPVGYFEAYLNSQPITVTKSQSFSGGETFLYFCTDLFATSSASNKSVIHIAHAGQLDASVLKFTFYDLHSNRTLYEIKHGVAYGSGNDLIVTLGVAYEATVYYYFGSDYNYTVPSLSKLSGTVTSGSGVTNIDLLPGSGWTTTRAPSSPSCPVIAAEPYAAVQGVLLSFQMLDNV